MGAPAAAALRPYRWQLVALVAALLPACLHGQGLLVPLNEGTNGSSSLGAAGPSSERLLALANTWRLTKEEAEAIGEPHGAGKMRLCIDPYTPGVICEPGSPNHGKFGGYQVMLFRMLSRDVPWLSDAQSWYFSCMQTQETYDQLVGRGVNGSCMMGTAAVPVLPKLLKMGIQPSWALEKTGLMIMTTASPDTHAGLWAPFAAYTWEVWACLFLTSLFVPLVLWVFEMASAYLQLPSKQEQRRAEKLLCAQKEAESQAESQAAAASSQHDDVEVAAAAGHLHGEAVGAAGDGTTTKQAADGLQAPKAWSEDWFMLHFRTHKKEAVDLLQEYIKRSWLKMARMVDPPAVNSLPSYAVLFGYGLLMTIIFALYTASAAAMLTTRNFRPAISSLSDLKGKAVGTWVEYVEPLSEHGLATVPFKWNNDADEEIMLQALASGFVQALILDERFVRYITGRRCNFIAVGQPFDLMDYGLGYNRRMQDELATDMDRYLQAAVHEGLPEHMARLYIEEGPGCASAGIIDSSQGVRLSQVWGLWVVLAICIGIAAVLNALQWLRRRKLKAAQKLAAQAVARSAHKSVTAAKRVLHNSQHSMRQASHSRSRNAGSTHRMDGADVVVASTNGHGSASSGGLSQATTVAAEPEK